MANASARAGITLAVAVMLALDGAAVVARINGQTAPQVSGFARSASIGAAELAEEERASAAAADDDARSTISGGGVTQPAPPSTAPRPTTPTTQPPAMTSTTSTGRPATTTTASGRQTVDGVGLYVVSEDGTDVRRVSSEIVGGFSWSRTAGG